MKSVLTLLVVVGASGAQPASHDVEVLVSNMGAYLSEYESQLSSVVAMETQRQSETRPLTGRTSLQSGIGSVRRRTIESEVSFLRLPGNGEWYGVRSVSRIDGKPVKSGGPPLIDVMKATGDNQKALIQEIVRASSEHNLGIARTINMPTVPLELLHPRNRLRFAFRAGGRARVADVMTQELKFQEVATPSLVQDISGNSLFAHGSVWIEPGTGRLWRVVVSFALAHRAAKDPEARPNELRVEFARDAALNMAVPKEMREDMDTAGGGRLQTRATYSQFRRFTTSARIIPPV